MTASNGPSQARRQAGFSKGAFRCSVSSCGRFKGLSRKGQGYVPTGRFYRLKLDRVALKARVRFVLELMCEFEREVALRFSDAPESESLNASYRKRNTPTDVLSFPAAEENLRMHKMGLPLGQVRRLGDLCLCVPVCQLQAKENRQTLAAELERMMVHGLCHLRGYDHERSIAAQIVMEALELSVRRSLITEFGKATWAEVSECRP
jgi:probable rRNA maturation factor